MSHTQFINFYNIKYFLIIKNNTVNYIFYLLNYKSLQKKLTLLNTTTDIVKFYKV